ncbi:hypothetical protein L1987_40242 [Smallanthus sonchifolius]|uniref:Uncharacterized protein n=1 Tax=Smallanthus sonchifolius TaxID=185202 RepID=A0ACB9GTU8_9ASTR|nr:hypothetical protein L1987_40242 [Smallanthus sonchifolius]
MCRRIFAHMRKSKVEYKRLFDHMYSRARLADIRLEDRVEGEIKMCKQGNEQQCEGPQSGDVGGTEENLVLPEITEEEKKSLYERRMKRRHDRPPQLDVKIKGDSGSVESDPSRPKPIGARLPPCAKSGQATTRRSSFQTKMMSKGNGIAQDSEHDHPRKKHKSGQEGLDEDILNLLSEASRNEIGFLKTQGMVNISQETSWDDLFDYTGFQRDVGNGGGSAGGEDIQG